MRGIAFRLLVFVTILSLGAGEGTASKCSGLIGFSSSGVKTVHRTGLIKFNNNNFDSGHGWVSDTGAFTVSCPGVYFISYVAYGDMNTRITLQKRGTGRNAKFEPIISTPPGGGAVTVSITLKTGEQIAPIVSGLLRTGIENSVPVTSFSAHKISD